MLTVSIFPGGRRHVSGNRCEKALRGESAAKPGENIFAYKRERIFAYPPLEPENAPRGEIGIPRVLNMYENYPFWATFFRDLGFRIILSPFSTRAIYELGMESIPSESECYPAKLAHGHAQWLIDHGIKTIFHPCVFYEHQEVPGFEALFAYLPNWKTTTLTRLWKGLYILLGTILLVIPGLIMGYTYAMTDYILAEHPDMAPGEVMKGSKAMMEGNRWRLFCLQFSFIGWMLLSSLTFGLGNLALRPYQEAAYAAFYREVSLG